MDSGLGSEFSRCPVAQGSLLAEISDDSLVVLQLSLYVAQQPDGTVFGLADDDHEVDEPFWLEHQPEGHEDVEVCGLGMSSRPLEYSLEIGRIFHQSRCRIMERRIMNDAYRLARGLVA